MAEHSFDAGKTRMIGLPNSEKKLRRYVKPFSSVYWRAIKIIVVTCWTGCIDTDDSCTIRRSVRLCASVADIRRSNRCTSCLIFSTFTVMRWMWKPVHVRYCGGHWRHTASRPPCLAPDRVLRHRAKKNDRHIDKLLLTHTIYAFTLTVRSEISNTQRKKFAYSYMWTVTV